MSLQGNRNSQLLHSQQSFTAFLVHHAITDPNPYTMTVKLRMTVKSSPVSYKGVFTLRSFLAIQDTTQPVSIQVWSMYFMRDRGFEVLQGCDFITWFLLGQEEGLQDFLLSQYKSLVQRRTQDLAQALKPSWSLDVQCSGRRG